MLGQYFDLLECSIDDSALRGKPGQFSTLMRVACHLNQNHKDTAVMPLQ